MEMRRIYINEKVQTNDALEFILFRKILLHL